MPAASAGITTSRSDVPIASGIGAARIERKSSAAPTQMRPSATVASPSRLSVSPTGSVTRTSRLTRTIARTVEMISGLVATDRITWMNGAGFAPAYRLSTSTLITLLIGTRTAKPTAESATPSSPCSPADDAECDITVPPHAGLEDAGELRAGRRYDWPQQQHQRRHGRRPCRPAPARASALPRRRTSPRRCS